MAGSIKLQITLAEKAKEKLQILCDQKGLSKSSMITIAIDKLFREEIGDNSK